MNFAIGRFRHDQDLNQWRNNGVGRVSKVQGPPSAGAPSSRQKKINKFADFGSKLHKNAFGGRDPLGKL